MSRTRDDDTPVLIVAHGSPSDPESQERALRDLAERVGALAGGRRIGGVTLAAEGRFDAMVETLGTPLLYPYFMARGWFTGKVLAERAKARGLEVMAPFGVEPALVACAADKLRQVLAEQGWTAAETSLLVAAHGSAVSRTSADSAHAFADAMRARLGFATTRCGFVEQAPFLAEAAQGPAQSICLPFFALNSGHMLDDVPDALEGARFAGPVLASFIDWPETPALIADSLQEYFATAR